MDDIDWFLKGNDSCNATDYPCYGVGLFNDERFGDDRAQWTDIFKQYAQGPSKGEFYPAADEDGSGLDTTGVDKCVANLWVSKLTGAGNAAVALTGAQATSESAAVPLPIKRPPTVVAPPVAGPSNASSAKGKDRGNTSDDQNVLEEMLRQDKEKHDLVRDQRMAHIKEEADRSDAIEVIYDKEDGQPIIRFRNKTDIFLDYSFDYSIVVGGETRKRMGTSVTLAPLGAQTYKGILSVNQDEGKAWSNLQVTSLKWWADRHNYDGTWR